MAMHTAAPTTPPPPPPPAFQIKNFYNRSELRAEVSILRSGVKN